MYPFEAKLEDLENNLEHFVDAVFASLVSDFMVMPKGAGFVEYPVFEQGYELLKRRTSGFTDISETTLLSAMDECQIVLVVVRSILGFTPSEWAYATTETTEVNVTQGFARNLDRKIRLNPVASLGSGPKTIERVRAMMKAAAQFMKEGAPEAEDLYLHRLAKADTCEGNRSVAAMAKLGVPYAMLLYERFLGRPFAAHRDSVSELVGSMLENAVEQSLTKAGISYRKTKFAEEILGFDQAPDFVIPNEFNPKVVIEAKITEDDGTARDKVTRVQHLAELSRVGLSEGGTRFEVIACIAGRGFAVRRSDMKKLILATRGKVFTLQNLNLLVDHTMLSLFRSNT